MTIPALCEASGPYGQEGNHEHMDGARRGGVAAL